MDVKTLSAMLGHVSAATTLDIYTHITDDMQRTAAANIDRGIGKAAPQEGASELGKGITPSQPEKPSMTDFKPYLGKKHARNVYAHTREECEEKLQKLIIEMKTDLAELKRKKAEGVLPAQEPEKDKKKGKKKAKKAKTRQ